jgi:cytochrome c oxidase cbb3-type subunit 2
MDKMFGNRPGIAADYAHITRTSFWQNTATLMGTERTGPDLTDVGNRQPSKDWHLMHLYNPRSVVKQSIMPSYAWLFEVKENPTKEDVIVNVPAEFRNGQTGKVIATKKALQLLAYIQSLKQAPLPTAIKPMDFLYKETTEALSGTGTATASKPGAAADPELLQGKTLYASNCQTCHQFNGEGLAGAFPSLKDSKVVIGDNLQLYVDIIMNGYDANDAYGVMPSVGKNMKFNEKQVAAIINYERTSWGNKGKKVSAEEVKKIMDSIKDK